MESKPYGPVGGLRVSEIALGSKALTGAYGRVGEAEILTTLGRALDIGFNLYDVAATYGDGRIERLLGRVISGRREQAVIATRCEPRRGPGRPTDDPGVPPERLRPACEASLRRLGVDHIDLYYVSGAGGQKPLEERLAGAADLVTTGKVRYIGLSEVDADQLRRACTAFPIAAVAHEYSLWERRPEVHLLPAAQELGIMFIATRPLGRGFLTGRVTSADALGHGDSRHGDSRFWPAHLSRNIGLLGPLEQLAAELDIGLPRLALAWLLSKPNVVPVPSSRSPLHLEMNAAARRIRLTADQCERAAALFPAAAIAGRRP